MASSQAQQEIYEPLETNSIRILSLLRGLPGSVIHCTLRNVPLSYDRARRYEALSYVWGSPEPTSSIILNGQPFTIRANLSAALNVLRHTDRERSLWIDAICINQLDIPERNAQVSIMYAVYRKAEAVLAWLGEEDDGIAELFEFLAGIEGDLYQAYLAPHFSLLPSNLGSSLMSSHTSIQVYGPLRQGLPLNEFLHATLTLSLKGYWKRLWIIQEILSATTVTLLCGSLSLPLYLFAEACMSLQALPNHNFVEGTWGVYTRTNDEIMGTSAYYIAKQYQVRGRRWSLQELIQLCSDCKSECQEPKDRIYGILSLARDKHGIVPDYGKSSLDLYTATIASHHFENLSWAHKLSMHRTISQLLQPFLDHNLEPFYVLQNWNARSTIFDSGIMRKIFVSGWMTMHPASIVIDVQCDRWEALGERHRASVAAANAASDPQRDILTAKWNFIDIFLQTDPRYKESCSCCTARFNPDGNGDLASIYSKRVRIYCAWGLRFGESGQRYIYSRCHVHIYGDNQQLIESCRQPELSTEAALFDSNNVMYFRHAKLWLQSLGSSSHGMSILSASEWDRNLRTMSRPQVKLSNTSSFGAGPPRKFLALHGLVGIGPCDVRFGDLLCHIDGSDQPYIILRYSPEGDSFDFVGPALILDRKGTQK